MLFVVLFWVSMDVVADSNEIILERIYFFACALL